MKPIEVNIMQIMHEKSSQEGELIMIKEITPEVIERAIDWLDTQTFCCHALASAIDDCSYMKTSGVADYAAGQFIEPLLERDNISNDGFWTYVDSNVPYRYSREDWLRKIAQELREGKI